MIHDKLVDFVKSHPFIYKAYYFVMSGFLGLLRLFIRVDKKLILFVSFGGRYFNESPKSLYEGMLKDSRYKDYRLVWAFRHPEQWPDAKERIKIDTLKYYITALKAKCWVTNVAIERGLKFKRKEQFYFHTTHGTLPKKGQDGVGEGGFLPSGYSNFDLSCAYSPYEAKIQLSMFGLKEENVFLSGLPKLDRLISINENEVIRIKSGLNLPIGKKIILYAPTYREERKSSMTVDVHFDRWKHILGDDFIVLFRAHPVVANAMDLSKEKGFIYDVSTYPENIELMAISDVLISDYSGIFFEFAVLNRPMFCYAYDYVEYVSKRPLYFDIRKELPGGMLKEDDLIEMIKNNPPQVAEETKRFREKFVTEYGHATNICIDRIFQEINKQYYKNDKV